MQEQKKFHQRKLAIIEMIEECDKRILNESNFIKRFNHFNLMGTMNNSNSNIDKYKKIKAYLTIRYNK